MNRHLHILACLLIICLLLPLSAQAEKKRSVKKKPLFTEQTSASLRPSAFLSEMKHWSNPDYTRISLELDRDVTWEAHELGKGSPGKPGRVYIDINRTKLSRNVRDITIGDGLLRGARVGQYKTDVVRVVLDTENIKNFKVFALSEPARLIIDVRGERPAEISRLEPSITSAAPETTAEPKLEAPAVVEGVRLVRSQFAGVLTRYGVERIESRHEPFNPAFHEAVGTVPVSHPAAHNVVIDQVEAGYRFGDRLLRPAKVVVGRHVARYH